MERISYSQRLGETMAYIARALGSTDVSDVDCFIIQIAGTVISPVFFSAGLYLTIGNLYVSLPRDQTNLQRCYCWEIELFVEASVLHCYILFHRYHCIGDSICRELKLLKQ